jgi:hypothetical protein
MPSREPGTSDDLPSRLLSKNRTFASRNIHYAITRIPKCQPGNTTRGEKSAYPIDLVSELTS